MQYQMDPTDQTQENDQKAHFWLFGSFKNAFWWFLNDSACAPNVFEHSHLSDYAISSWSDRPNSRKCPKMSFLAHWVIQKWIFNVFEWSSMCAKCFRTFISIRLCNIKLTRQTKLKKMAKNLIFGYLDHSKMIFHGFWMIQHVRYGYQIVKDI